MQALFDHRPQVLEAYGNDIYRYRYDIEDISTEEGIQFSAQEVKIYAPISANKITAAVIADRWDNNFEQKLVNEYTPQNSVSTPRKKHKQRLTPTPSSSRLAPH